MKYKNSKQVMIALLNGSRLKSVRDLKYKYRNINPEYYKIIDDGILMYEEYLADQQLRNLIDPDYELTALEFKEVAEKYNKQD